MVETARTLYWFKSELVNLGYMESGFISSGGNSLVPYLIHLMKDTAPFAVGILAICALAAMQSTGAAYMSTASGMLTRDIVKRFIKKDMSETQQTYWRRRSEPIRPRSAP